MTEQDSNTDDTAIQQDKVLQTDGGTQVAERTDDDPAPEPLFDQAKWLDLNDYFGWRVERFIEALLEETDYTDESVTRAKTAQVFNYTSSEPLELLLVYSDGVRQFIGEDETAKGGTNLFSFFIEPESCGHPVRTTDEALNLLKPAGVQNRLALGEETPQRQGEWWLLEDAGEPESRIFKPGVNTRPFGESPLINHVPREYALGVSAETFVERFKDACPSLASWVETPEDAFQKLRQASQMGESDEIELLTPIISEQELYELAQGVYVRGTLRHRSNEHYMENVGEEWKLAVTHDVDVWTVDSFDLTNDSSSTVRYD